MVHLQPAGGALMALCGAALAQSPGSWLAGPGSRAGDQESLSWGPLEVSHVAQKRVHVLAVSEQHSSGLQAQGPDEATRPHTALGARRA